MVGNGDVTAGLMARSNHEDQRWQISMVLRI